MTTLEIQQELHFDDRLIKVFSPRMANLTEFFEASVRRFPKKEALVGEINKLTYEELAVQVNRVACNLHELGVGPNDRVGILTNNTIEFVLTAFAVAQLAAISVPLNARLKSAELEFMLNHSAAKVLVVEGELYENIAPIRKMVKTLEHVFISGNGFHGCRDFSELLEPVEGRIRHSAREEDTAFIMYTSGTTGVPKGAMLTHLGVIHSVMNYIQVLKTDSDDITLLTVPLFHVTGLIGQLLHLIFLGGKVVLQRRYKTEDMLLLMEREKVTFSFMVPTIYVFMLMADLSKYDLSAWRLAAYGGAPMSKDTVEKLKSQFPNLNLHNAYGATETSSPATILPCEDCLRKISSVGLPVPTGECKVVGEEGQPLPPEHVGELWIKGPHVIPGYWQNEQANQKEFSDGYWHSGDLAKMDEEGYVYIMDRKKDMINRGGEKIFCVEVEDVLYSHPKVLEAAVIGVPDQVFGEQVMAVIVAKPGESPTEREIRDFVSQKLADFKTPKFIKFIPALPRNPGGKVLKNELRKLTDTP